MEEWFNSLKKNHNYGGLGGSIKDPSNSLLSTDIIQYDDNDNKYEFPKKYKKRQSQPITDKTNEFINRFVGKNVDVYYILDTRHRKEIRIVRVLDTFQEGGRYFFKLKTKHTFKIR